jgi:hypothetical protein
LKTSTGGKVFAPAAAIAGAHTAATAPANKVQTNRRFDVESEVAATGDFMENVLKVCGAHNALLLEIECKIVAQYRARL